MRKPKKKTVIHRKNTYTGTRKGGVVTVKVAATTKGQEIHAGTYNTQSKAWVDGKKNYPLPEEVKRQFEVLV